MIKSLQHVGVLGMHWGVRKGSSDHERVASIRKKRLRNMTDEEINTVAKRIRLINAYKKAGGRTSSTRQLSNQQLENATRRRILSNESWRVGVRMNKRIKDMTDEEVKKTLSRHLLEKSYKELTGMDLSPISKLVKAVLVLNN